MTSAARLAKAKMATMTMVVACIERQVASLDREQHQSAQSRVAEDRLGDYQAPHQPAHPRRDHGHRGQQRVAQHMAEEDAAEGEALEIGGAHVVGPEHLRGARAGHADDVGEAGQRHGHGGQDEVGEGLHEGGVRERWPKTRAANPARGRRAW